MKRIILALALLLPLLASAAPPVPSCWPIKVFGDGADNINYDRIPGVGRWWAWTCPDHTWAAVWVTDSWINAYTKVASLTLSAQSAGSLADLWRQHVKDEGGAPDTAKLKVAALAYLATVNK